MSTAMDPRDDERPAWLDSALDGLPRDVAPGHDLWPAIARRIRRRQPNWVPAAAAASVLLSVVAALFAWQSYRAIWTSSEALSAASIVQIQDSYRFARHDFESDWSMLRSEVDPEVAAIIDRNLEVIRAARGEIDRALVRAPDDPALRGLLQSTLSSEIALYRKARELAPESI